MNEFSTDYLLSNYPNLSEDELKYLQIILKELADNGSSETLNEIYSQDYEEVPVDIDTFITDKRYLGNSLVTDSGECTVYPYWRKVLKSVFSKNSGITSVALSGSIGTGKSTTAVIGLCYVLYKLLCLRNPASYYRLNKGSRIAIAFFNLSLTQSYGVAYSKMQSYLKASPWFLEHGKLIGRTYSTYYPDKDIELVVGSKQAHFIGRDIFAGILDELDYAPGADINFEKSQILKLYNSVQRRIESRFMVKGNIPGILFLVSSKNSEHDFLEQYINKNRNKPNLLIVDEPLWVIKADVNQYSGKTFNLAVGNRYNKSRILDDNEDPIYVERSGQRVIKVPVEHREAFELDINTALADIAGIAIQSSSKYMIPDKIISSYRSYLHNPFKSEIISVGFDDSSQIKDFMDINLLPKLNRNKPHYIHWDTSKNGDKTGLAMTTTTNEAQVRRLVKGSVKYVTDIVHKIVFGVSIKAMPGEEIPFYKIRNFIYYLREIGFNIASISCDGFQSLDSIQQFKLQGFNAEVLSMDRSREPYDTAKNAYNEGRVISPKIQLLETELIELEDVRIRNKIDHPENGSKDLSDAVCACIYKANRSQSVHIASNTASDLLAINSKIDQDYDEDWILPEGTIIVQ